MGYTYVANWELGLADSRSKEHSLDKLLEQWQISKNTTALKIYQVHSATFESGILENSDVLKRLYEIKKRYRLTNRYHDKWITSK
jgi:hypothetical protein